MYLTYNEYLEMGGTLDSTSYGNFEFEAEAVINWYTFNRLKNDTEFPVEVKRLMKYLIDAAQRRADLMSLGNSGENSNSGAGIASQSNDGVSISYNVLNASEIMNDLKDQESGVINRYLQNVTNELGQRVLYRGLYPNE